MVDRTETARALAKTIAYLGCGKREEAISWAVRLIRLLGLEEILK
jgi:hypothetical protein